MAVILKFPAKPKPVEGETDARVGSAVVIRFPVVERAPAPVAQDARPGLSRPEGAGFEPGLCPGEETSPTASGPAGRRLRAASVEEDQRKAMLGKVHIAKKDLMLALPEFNDGTYRFILEHNFGVSSAADLSNAQLHSLLIHFASLGWQVKKGRHRRTTPAALTHDATGLSREARMEKIEAFLAEKGRVEGTDMPWGYAVAILKRQTANDPDGQVRSFDKATPQQLDDVIAALYRDAKRKRRRVR